MPKPSPRSKATERPSMRKIAAVAGVSAMTVSRALRDNPRITPAVRKRIRKIALELGYRPDPEVAKLMNHLRRRDKPTFVASIAAVTSIPESQEPHQLLKARENARLRAEELGYRLEVFRISTPDLRNRQLERTLVNRGIEGVLLLQMHTPTSVDELLGWEKFSAVVATPSVLSPEFPRVGAHHFHNARLLCEQLAQRGGRRIGFVGSTTFCIRTAYAFAAAAGWQSIADGRAPVKPLIYEGWPLDDDKLRHWFAQERPDAIIAHSADAIPDITRCLGLRPGGPILLACTNVNALDLTCPGIDERHDLIGRKAVDVLTSLLNRNEKNFRTTHTNTLIDGQWIEPAPPAAAAR